MIISRTPFRVSFFGGGTDYPVWYRENGGAVLSTTINKYCYISCRKLPPFFEYRSRILYSKMEYVREVSEIQHPAVREALRYLKIEEGVELHHDGDLPARTGIGSSSTFSVGLFHALYALLGRMTSKHQLAWDALHLEHALLQEAVGSQDPVAAAYGGLNRIDFLRDGSFTVSPVILRKERLVALQSYCLLIFTGFVRTASEIAEEQVREIPARKSELTRMHEMVGEAVGLLQGSGDLVEFGRLLHEGWQLKRRLSSRIATRETDAIYEAGLQAGAVGGKILGAGGGGFMLLFARPEDHARIREKLPKLLHVPFRFETLGSQIIHYEPFDQES